MRENLRVPTESDLLLRIVDDEIVSPIVRQQEMDRIYQWSPLTMGWCLECHRKPPAETDVATDHALSERYPPPEMPEGRQEKGLYPVRIDSEFGASRGPIDCLACHY